MLSIALRALSGLAALSAVASVLLSVRSRRAHAAAVPPAAPAIAPLPAATPVSDLLRIGISGEGEGAQTNRAASVGARQTRHGRLVLDADFARRIGLLDALAGVALPGKTVRHSPQDHLVTAWLNILAGHTQLPQISRGDNPLRNDRALALA